MVDIRPFRGLRYSLKRIGDLSTVISPPYDIISPEEQRLYHDKSPYNVIRLELGEELPSDSAENNKYTRAAAILKSWIGGGILVREAQPAFYIFQHRFLYGGIVRDCWGLTARLHLEGWDTRRVRPHEVTSQQHITDRLHILRACQINLSPVWGILRHEENGLLYIVSRLAKGVPEFSVVDHYGVVYKMWVITDPSSIKELSSFCADKVLYIADGHHRYETALIYQKEQSSTCSSCTGEEGFNFVMMTVMDAGDPGLLMLPTHRLVRLGEGQSIEKLRKQLTPIFSLEEVPPYGSGLSEKVTGWLDILKERGKGGATAGVYGLSGENLCLLLPRDKVFLQRIIPTERSHPWKELDISLLHSVIFQHLMGIDGSQREKECLEYTQDALEAICRVDSGEYQLAFLLNPVPLSQVLEVADAGDRMPRKSTYFYPKLPTGLVMNPLWED